MTQELIELINQTSKSGIVRFGSDPVVVKATPHSHPVKAYAVMLVGGTIGSPMVHFLNKEHQWVMVQSLTPNEQDMVISSLTARIKLMNAGLMPAKR